MRGFVREVALGELGLGPALALAEVAEEGARADREAGAQVVEGLRGGGRFGAVEDAGLLVDEAAEGVARGLVDAGLILVIREEAVGADVQTGRLVLVDVEF